ncbi:MAG: DNA-formamidopyrimidine glycosylase [bacterium]
MPELPEVETLRRELNKLLVGQTIKNVEVLWTKAILPMTAKKFTTELLGQKVESVDRRAKMLIVNFSNGKSLVFHLKMTGQVIFVPKKGGATFGGHPTSDVQTPGKHTRLILEFKNGDHLYFNDMRKFGWSRLVSATELNTLTSHSGPEPLSKDFSADFLFDLFQKYPNRTLKQILLDQTLIAGIGNIYADESCFLSGLMPNRKAGTVNQKQAAELYKQIVAVLKLSISKGGTSSRNYRRSDGSRGSFVPCLMVYGRAGETCKKCRALIQKIKHAGRGTHFCPQCQH